MSFSSSRPRQQGFSLMELMIAMTIGLILLLGVTVVFMSSSQTRSEADKAGRQIENGRFATETLKEDIQLAGFYGNYVPLATTNWTTPDPCNTVGATTTADALTALQADFTATTSPVKLPVAIYGYANYNPTGSPPSVSASCIQNRAPGTDMFVIRRTSTTEIDIAGGGAISSNDFYLQVSACSDSPAQAAFVLDSTLGNFTLNKVVPTGTPPSCLNGPKAPVNKYLQHIYYISTCNDCHGSGDGIPTLKMVELPGTSTAPTTCPTGESSPCPIGIAEGIQDMRLEYGVDAAGTGTPSSFTSWSSGTVWKNVIAVKVFLLARNTETTSGYQDTKTYSLSSDGTLIHGGASFNDGYKRHVYAITARSYNLANRR